MPISVAVSDAVPRPAPAPQSADGTLAGFDLVAKRAFKALNRFFLVPALRAGLGPWLGSPLGGTWSHLVTDQNLLLDPPVEVWLPAASWAAPSRNAPRRSEPGSCPRSCARRSCRRLLAGINAWRATDEQLLAAVDFAPLIRIDPTDGWVKAGPDDPGGTAW